METAESMVRRKILIAPLDWGLGHATRCIPIINECLQQGASPVLAGSGAVKHLLQAEFPQLPFVDLEGYEVSYSRNRWSLPFVIAAQIPKILSAVQYENERLQEIVKEHEIHAIISDNRYGLYHETLPSVLITHQLRIRTGWGNTADEWLQSLHYKHITKFDQCWVPDWPQAPGLAGELSHPARLPGCPLHYLGPLSRMQAGPQKEEHLLVLLSGPEPQRTILEKLLMEQLPSCNDSVVMVRGLPAATDLPEVPGNISLYNHVPARLLNRLMNEAKYVISRCGYSTVMDLATLGKKAILVPTPGQTEQEYLARHLMERNLAFCVGQDKFRLMQALDLAKNFSYRPFEQQEVHMLPKSISHLLQSI